MHHPQPSLIQRLKDRIKASLDALLLDLRSTGERGRLVREMIVTMGLRVGALGIAFIASIIYARTLQAKGYGVYAYVIAWYDVALIPVGLGLQEYLVREAAKDTRPERLRGILRWADKRLLISGVLGALALSGIGYLLPAATAFRPLFLVAAWLPLLAVLAFARQSILRASNAVVASQWPQLLMAPALMLALLLVWWWVTGLLTPTVLIAAMLASLAACLAVQSWQVRRHLTRGHTAPADSLSLKGAFPFMWLSAIWLVNSRMDLLILGSLKSSADVGVYAVVVRVAGLMTLTTATVSTIISPRISAYFHGGEQAKLQRLLGASAHRTFLLCLPLALVLVFAGGSLLDLAFGGEFARGWVALDILAFAQLLNVLFGPVGVTLYMTGQESIANRIFTASAVLNVILNFLFIPRFDIVGAAVATSISLVAWNLGLWLVVRRRLKLRPTAIGI
ncbi:MAG: polysaccharide biosynthesis C-terminal domain-containing protein [Gammaproteobacteria bacterium]